MSREPHEQAQLEAMADDPMTMAAYVKDCYPTVYEAIETQEYAQDVYRRIAQADKWYTKWIEGEWIRATDRPPVWDGD